MNPSRIAELLDPFLDSSNGQRLTTNDLERISTYIDILQHWNARVNLTAIRAEEEIVTRHFGESLFAARHLFPREKKSVEGAPPLSRSVRQGGDFEFLAVAHNVPSKPRHEGNKSHVTLADLGSGAGFPGIPIKLWAPEIKLTLIESNQKKATFLREIVRALTLTDVDVQNTRAESLTDISFNVVTLRAIERFESILPVAANLIARGGHLALLIGQLQLPQAQSALPTLTWSAPITIPQSEARILAVAAHS